MYSPPACPEYNGAIEAGIGSLKTRTQASAHSHGRLLEWTDDDLAYARAEANHTPRQRGGSAADAWSARQPITPVERVCFDLITQRRRFEVRKCEGITLDTDLDHWQSSALDRKALSRALVEHGDLTFTRRSIPLTLKHHKTANIM